MWSVSSGCLILQDIPAKSICPNSPGPHQKGAGDTRKKGREMKPLPCRARHHSSGCCDRPCQLSPTHSASFLWSGTTSVLRGAHGHPTGHSPAQLHSGPSVAMGLNSHQQESVRCVLALPSPSFFPKAGNRHVVVTQLQLCRGGTLGDSRAARHRGTGLLLTPRALSPQPACPSTSSDSPEATHHMMRRKQ